MESYFGRYEYFEVPNKKDAGVLLGADNMVGDVYDIEGEMDGSQHTMWLVNRFGQRPGCFDSAFSRELSLLKARGLACKAILSFVAFTDHPGDGHYWGEVAVICYNPAYEEEFSRFISGVSARIADKVRPKIDFTAEGVDRIIESGGDWLPTQTEPMPAKAKGTAIMKDHRKLSDKMIEQGRAGNKGCYVVSWVFLLVLVAVIVLIFVRCSGVAG